MPDIRTTPLLDDFTRAAEDPLLPPWYQPAWADTWMQLDGNAIGSNIANPNFAGGAYLSEPIFSGFPIEMWAQASGNMPLHASYQWGLLSYGLDGYVVHAPNPVGDNFWRLYRVSGGSFSSMVSVGGLDEDWPTQNDWVLMRLGRTSIELWLSKWDSVTNPDATTWMLMLSASDGTFRDRLSVFLGARDGGPGWRAVGGGEEPNKTQIYRYVSN